MRTPFLKWFGGFGRFEGARLQACRQRRPEKPALPAEGHLISGPKGRPISSSFPARPKPRCVKDGRASFRRHCAQLLLILAAAFLFLGATDNEARFNNLGHRMMCTCGCGQVLLECNHVGCQTSEKMRNELLAALSRGDNDDLILQGFVQEYGPTVIAAPTTTGFNRVAWVAPFVALALGLALVVVVVRAWKNRPAPVLADGIRIPKGNELDEFRQQARKETDL